MFNANEKYKLINDDCLSALKQIPDASVDSIVTDPPYPCIDRSYGRFSENEWHELMNSVMPELRRVLKPSGSAMVLLQPNSESCGKMRLWLWEFLLKWGKQWNLIQDCYCMNVSMLPSGCSTTRGLMRPSVKMCCWFGSPDAYRNQSEILWGESQDNRMQRLSWRANNKNNIDEKRITKPSGHSMKISKLLDAAEKRGGVTPFNFFPVANAISNRAVNGAGTPIELARYWVRYITPVNGICLDPFAGVATIGRACLLENRKYVGIEKNAEFFQTAIQEMQNP